MLFSIISADNCVKVIILLKFFYNLPLVNSLRPHYNYIENTGSHLITGDQTYSFYVTIDTRAIQKITLKLW